MFYFCIEKRLAIVVNIRIFVVTKSVFLEHLYEMLLFLEHLLSPNNLVTFEWDLEVNEDQMNKGKTIWTLSKRMIKLRAKLLAARLKQKLGIPFIVNWLLFPFYLPSPKKRGYS